MATIKLKNFLPTLCLHTCTCLKGLILYLQCTTMYISHMKYEHIKNYHKNKPYSIFSSKRKSVLENSYSSLFLYYHLQCTFISKVEIISKKHLKYVVRIKLIIIIIGVMVASSPFVHARCLETFITKPVISVSLLFVTKHRVDLAHSCK